MSAAVPYKHWLPSTGETDANVKQSITSSAAALTVPSGANAVRLTFEKNASSTGGETPIVRSYRHGTDPTANDGKPHYNAEERDLFGIKELRDTKFISADGNTQTVYCQWYTV